MIVPTVLGADLYSRGGYLLASVVHRLRTDYTRMGVAGCCAVRWYFFNRLACTCLSLTLSGHEHLPKDPSWRHILSTGPV
jgi:hypothetical protein